MPKGLRGLRPVINDVPLGLGGHSPKSIYRRYRPKGGRPTFIEVEQISRERFIAVCQSLGTVQAVAEHYQTTTKTIRATLKRFGIVDFLRLAEGPTKSPLTAYLTANPTVVVTHDNTDEIARASGLSRRSVTNWLRHRRLVTQQFINSCESLTRLEGSLVDLRGRTLPFSGIREYTANVQMFDAIVILKGVMLVGGPFTAQVGLWEFLRATHAEGLGPGRRGPEVMWTYPREKEDK